MTVRYVCDGCGLEADARPGTGNGKPDRWTCDATAIGHGYVWRDWCPKCSGAVALRRAERHAEREVEG